METKRENKQTEAVNHPHHYSGDGGIECIDAMVSSQGVGAVVAFCHLNAFKYIWRAGRKDKSKYIEDLKKAKWYIDKEIDLIKNYGKV